MATIINNPDTTPRDGSGGAGVVLAVVIVALVVIALLVYGLPGLRHSASTTPGTSGATVNVPGKVDVNVNKQ
jgi:hypothetical protein